ncbi:MULTISPECIES: hypothetical protein [Acinetobacter calcoaceticus/baumannii complex]|uniref:Lipoprotein n=1 Tax=Acinetobacter nosocomialis TaxID=106654 RepID=A0AB37CPK0_ACINO|nr:MULTISPECIES: hypothetical protein [Acinetobacter calcoaceticus/baumannii complex]ELW77102.1 hypothetical protein ACIN5021_0175 [Acinetobacter sp. OIFC021]EXE47932.1 hypothetical protein J576_3319 [Acinetobacter sp. 766875]MDE1666925.1 hypothetical protein [Acinetobacter nosocomialis]MDE9417521.1 hypothetical protein [Acinetobacter nosocomialis]MDQ9030914.1 hypothetical protein [Acinetobacter nosocomialis]
MKNIYILIFIGALMACSDKSPDKTQHDANHKSDVVQVDKNQSDSAVSEKKESAEKELKTADQVGEISCSNPNITQWYGFNESVAEPKCEVVKNFQLSAYKCDISKNAFGENKDAILLENQDKRIFVYSTSKDCNEMLEIRNANGP